MAQAQAESVVSARDKELTDPKVIMKWCEQMFYNMGFTNAVNSCGTIIFKAWRHRFSEGWMETVNALSLPKSLFSRIPPKYLYRMIHLFRPELMSSLIKKVMRRGKIAPV